MAEKWKPIIDAHRYEVSDLGNVRKAGTHELLKPLESMRAREGSYVALKLDGGGHATRKVDRLVANTFGELHSPYKYLLIHKDKDQYNNRFDNLEWKPKMKSVGKIITIVKGDFKRTYKTKTDLAMFLGMSYAARTSSVKVLEEAERQGYEVRVTEKADNFDDYETRDEKLTSDPKTKKFIRKKIDEFVEYLSERYDSTDMHGKHTIGTIDEDDPKVIDFRKFQKKYNL